MLFWDRRTARRWCRECGRHTPSERQKQLTSLWMLLHAALVLMTCGLWLPVAVWAMGHVWVCAKCGTRT